MNEIRIFDENDRLINIIFSESINVEDGNVTRTEVYPADLITNTPSKHESLRYLNFIRLLKDFDANNIPASIIALMCDEAANNRHYRDFVYNTLEACAIAMEDKYVIANYAEFYVLFVNALLLIMNKTMMSIVNDSKDLYKSLEEAAGEYAIKNKFLWDE